MPKARISAAMLTCASSISVRVGIIELSPFRDRSINDR
jgi:hypothetical protein